MRLFYGHSWRRCPPSDGDYDLTGVGAAQDANGVVHFTQIFVKKR